MIKKIIVFLILSFVISVNAFSQGPNSGKEFWVAFGKNDIHTTIDSTNLGGGSYKFNVEIILRITTLAATQVKLHFNADTTLNTTLSVPAGTIRDYKLNLKQTRAVYTYNHYNSNPLYTSMRSIRVTASQPISLVALNSAYQSVEATHVSPVQNYGKEYVHVGYNAYGGHSNGFLIVATEDNTTVDFTKSYTTPSVTLKKGEVYYYNDVLQQPIGMHISASKPISFFQHNSKGNVGVSPNNDTYRDNLMFEQIPPVEQWGTRFIMFTNELNAGMVRVYATDYPTEIEIKTKTQAQPIKHTLTAGNTQFTSYRDIRIDYDPPNLFGKDTALYITSNKPVSVATYHLPPNNADFMT